MNAIKRYGRHVMACALAMIVSTVSAAEQKPLDFDPALLLDEPATAKDPRPATPAKTPVSPSTKPATAPTPARLAPLDGELLNYVSQSTTAWSLRPGETLREALSRWSGEAGWTLIWKAPRDFRIEAALSLPQGTQYVDAVKAVVRAVWRTNPTLHATTYTNRVLVITDGKEATR